MHSETSTEIRNDPAEHSTTELRVDEFEACQALLWLQEIKNDVGIQVNTDDLPRPSFLSYITTDSTLNTLTRIPAMATLNGIAQIIKEQTQQTYKDNLTVEEKIVLTLMKLKHDLSYAMLAALFRVVSRYTVSRIFKKMVVTLSKVLSPLID